MSEILEPGILTSPRSPVCPRFQSSQDPSQPKIPVIPRSQSFQDPSHPKIPVSQRSQSALDGLMPIWYLAHAYLLFGLCYCIWLMWNSHQLNFSSIYYIIWQKCIFPSLKKWMRQGPAIFLFSNFFQFHYYLCINVWEEKTWPSHYIAMYCDGQVFYLSDVRYILVLMNTYCIVRSFWEQFYWANFVFVCIFSSKVITIKMCTSIQ